jgi:Zn-dependent protease with chaperone function
MPGESLEEIKPYPNISAKAYEHPADRAATAALKAIPMLDTVVRKILEWRYEKALRQHFLANSVKVGDSQLPQLWRSHQAVTTIMDLPEVNELYVSKPVPGVGITFGTKSPIIVVDAGYLQLLDAGEQRALVGHELGHVLSDHMTYMTVLSILISAGSSLPMIGLPLLAVRAVLLEWYRAAELSCDRAATLAVRDPRIVCSLLMTIAAGMPARELNLDAFLAQAMEYQTWEDSSDRLRRFLNELNFTHPNAVRRVAEVMAWVKAGDYDRIQRGEYRTRDQPDNVREEAGDAVDYYTERFKAIFREMGENIANLGSQVGEQGQKLAEWLRSRKSGPPFGGDDDGDSDD